MCIMYFADIIACTNTPSSEAEKMNSTVGCPLLQEHNHALAITKKIVNSKITYRRPLSVSHMNLSITKVKNFQKISY